MASVKRQNYQAFLKATRSVKEGSDLIQLPLEGSFLQRLRAALGTIAIGPVVASVSTQAGATHLFLTRPALPRRLGQVLPWIRASFAHLPAVAFTVNVVVLTSHIVRVAVVTPAYFLSCTNVLNLAGVLFLMALYLDARRALKGAVFFRATSKSER